VWSRSWGRGKEGHGGVGANAKTEERTLNNVTQANHLTPKRKKSDAQEGRKAARRHQQRRKKMYHDDVKPNPPNGGRVPWVLGSFENPLP